MTTDVYPQRPGLQAPAYTGASRARYIPDARTVDPSAVWRRYRAIRGQTAGDDGRSEPARKLRGLLSGPRLEAEGVAAAFAMLADALERVGQREISRRDILAGAEILRGCVVARPGSVERLTSCVLAAGAAGWTGLPVHLILPDEAAARRTAEFVSPVFAEAGLSCGLVTAGQADVERKRSYQSSVAIAAVRELAMDGLRDDVYWPAKASVAERIVDPMLGERSKSRSTIMRGLGFAILLDVDHTLIDQARIPVILTRDGHPIYDANALGKGFELARALEPGRHYLFTEADAEIGFTAAGSRMLEEWSAQMGGVWSADQTRQFLVGIAIVADRLLTSGVHYDMVAGGIRWRVDDKLLPGVKYYTKAFLAQALEHKEQCVGSGERESLARTNYQRYFKRYMYLGGTAYSVRGIRRELKSVYGLSAIVARDEPRRGGVEGVRVAPTRERWLNALVDKVRRREERGARILVVRDDDAARAVSRDLEARGCANRIIDEEVVDDNLEPEHVLIWPAERIGAPDPASAATLRGTGSIVMAQRMDSTRREARVIAALCERFETPPSITWLLSLDDPILEDCNSIILRFLRRCESLSETRPGRFLSRWAMHRSQLAGERALRDARRELRRYDANMRDLLAFSGRS